MKTKAINKLLVLSLFALLIAAGCSNGKNGATGATGAQGTQGATGPTGPTVTWVMPIPGATDVFMDSVVKVGFSNPMSPTTINSSTFMVSTGGINVTGTVSYNSGSQTAFFSPNFPLSAFGSYKATLTTGIKDTAGNPLTTYSWTFVAGGSTTPSRLYVTNGGGNSISVFNNASITQGNIAPDSTISGAATTFNSPYGMWHDSASDRLYVANFDANSILIFNNASTISGNVAPNRTIAGAATTLNYPESIWYDSASDRLYVANEGADSILVYYNASTINGNVAPDSTISGGATALNGPAILWFDAASDTLYVTNYTGSILIFNSASTLTGNVAPVRTISGAATLLNQPYGTWYDSTSDSLYVADYSANSIFVFSNASTINGNVAPDRIISGASTTLKGPVGIWFDSASDRLYTGNWSGNTILVFNNASTLNGDVAPNRTISGLATGLDSPYGIWLDLNP